LHFRPLIFYLRCFSKELKTTSSPGYIGFVLSKAFCCQTSSRLEPLQRETSKIRPCVPPPLPSPLSRPLFRPILLPQTPSWRVEMFAMQTTAPGREESTHSKMYAIAKNLQRCYRHQCITSDCNPPSRLLRLHECGAHSNRSNIRLSLQWLFTL
jgi:hypothetical protein